MTQTSFDSASPGGSAVVVRRFEEPGAYELEVLRKDEPIAAGSLVVGAELSAAQAAPGMPGATTVDIADMLRPGAAAPSMPEVPAGGYVSFTAPRPAGPVRVRGVDAETADEFDSRRLDSRCVFALTLVRPGRYSLTDAIAGTRGTIVVTYPQVGKVPYRPPGPLTVECREDGLSHEEITLSPGQGIVFQIRAESRIQIELVEPDDGPAADEQTRSTRWRRPPEPPSEDQAGA